MSYEKYHKTTVESSRLRPYVKELVDRCGSTKLAAEYAMIGTGTIYRTLNNVHGTMQLSTANKIILALRHRREEDRKNHEVHERLLKARQLQAMIEDKQERLTGY